MAKEIPNCPVCGNPLASTDLDPNLYFCTIQKVWVSDLGMHVDTVDATINFNNEGKVVWQVIEIPPYRFVMTDDEKGQHTSVMKYIAPEETPWSKTHAKTYERRVILTVPSLIKMPWDNKKKVLERMKTLLLFL